MIRPVIVKYGSPEYEEMLALRTRILREPLGLSFSAEDLEKERDDTFLAIYDSDEGKVVACSILVFLAHGVAKLRQMAVDSNAQQAGLGTAMLSFAEYVAIQEGYEKITLHARKTAAGFYEKYGYRIIGDEFTEVGIPHFEMEKILER